MKCRAIAQRRVSTGVVGLGILLSILIVSCSGIGYGTGNQHKETREVTDTTVVIARQPDPYFGLARRIAREEGLELVEEFADVLRLSPKFVILVASPDNLNAERLASIGRIFEDSEYYPGFGIISGSTVDLAERLWARRNLAKEGKNYVGGDTEPLQLVYEPTIYDVSSDAPAKTELNKATLIAALKQADYFYWTRHTGPRDWSWNEETGMWTEKDQLLAQDIPDLKPAVIYNLTCSSFRPWVENSIALGFVDKGAAAFLGFVNTPHAIAFMKHGLSVPGITSWRDFPLGLVAQVHNKVATETVFGSPQLFLLGDPRIYLSTDQPYRITSDTVVDKGRRILAGESDENRVMSVKIEGGAAYDFLSIKGWTSVSEEDVFYNHRLQTLDLGADKYVLFYLSGGQFEIELLEKAPLGWRLTDAIADSFDFSWLVLWLSTYADSNPNIHAVSIMLFAVILLFKIFRPKRPLGTYGRIFLVALALSFVRLAYFLLRMDDYSVSANLVSYAPSEIAVGTVGTFASLAAGLVLIKDSTSFRVRSIGLLIAVARQFWLAGFYLTFTTLLNVVTQITRNTQPWLLSYDSFWLSFTALVFEIAVVLALYRLVIAEKGSRTTERGRAVVGPASSSNRRTPATSPGSAVSYRPPSLAAVFGSQRLDDLCRDPVDVAASGEKQA